MPREILFLHGAGEGAHAEDQKLVEDLMERLGDGYHVHYPRLPREDSPDPGPWRAAILKEIEKLPEGSLLVGHSLGGSVLLQVLSETSIEATFGGIFLLAAPFWGGDEDWQYEGFTLKEGFAARLPKAPLFLYHNRDDDIVPVTHVRMYAEHLPHASKQERAAGGHPFEAERGMQDIVDDILKLARQT